ncbi:MAG: hypothetical protein ACJ77Z_18300 [Thermoleophilaceae bacterium]
MFGMSDAHHFRKMVAGFCMMVAPVFVLVGLVLDPDTSYVFLFLGAVSSVPAVLGLMHMLREREVEWGHAGGTLALFGLMAMTALIGMDLATWQAAGSAVTDTATIVHRVDHMDGLATVLFVCSLMFGAGYLALGMGLYRAHAIAAWSAICLMVGAIAFDVALIASSAGVAIVGIAAILVGQGMLGLTVWRESDEAWERTPELA